MHGSLVASDGCTAVFRPTTILFSSRKFCDQVTIISGQRHLGKLEARTNLSKIVVVAFEHVASLASLWIGSQSLCSVTTLS